jgi:Flp pilus assembly protein protease CpaA
MPVIFLILLFAGLLIATYRDVLTREVPDTVSYALIVIGLLGGLIAALVLQDLTFFLERLFGFIGGVAIGMLMFYTRQWGGGDAKLIMGVGAILGLGSNNLQLIEFLILLIFCGAAYGIIYTLVLALSVHRKIFLPAFSLYVRTKFVHRLRIGLVVTGVVFVILIIIAPYDRKIMLGLLLLAIYLLVYAWIFMKVVEQHIMLKQYPVSKLTEGDWVAKDVKAGKKLLVSAKSTGITNAQISALKKSRVRYVLVKEGIPFVPGFLLAFIALLLIHAYMGEASIITFFF